ncbi:uncharacterized protein [Hetaerina americana]|uniref:uncharacterized protein n=1 Tax=Hetaerina americana TaxID=62018 RepID=UPI003A7F2016
MPWPPRLFSRHPLAALASLLLVALLLPPLPCSSSAATISYADGQPEYPSQPEVTSDRNALARFFLQSLIEKEGKTRNPHSYTNGEESDDWSGDGLSSKRSNAVNTYKSHHQSSLKDIYPHLRYNDDERGSDGAFDNQEGDLAILEPHVDREKIITGLLARRYPSLHGDGALPASGLTDDDRETRLEQWARLGIGKQSDPTDFLREFVDHHRSPPGTPSSLFKNKRSALGGGYSLNKRDPFGINARGFHDDVFYRDFGSFNPMKRVVRSVEPEEAEDLGRENKTNAPVSKSLGAEKPAIVDDSSPKRAKRSAGGVTPKPAGKGALKREERAVDTPAQVIAEASKRRPEMSSSGFHGDTFSGGFGDFWTMKRNLGQEEGSLGKLGKRRPEMDSSGFHGDTFNSGFGDFWTMKRAPSNMEKRRPEMDSSGFHGDTFSSGFGDFYTMKRAPSWDNLSEGKRRPEMDSSGFHGDTFNSGFGDFWTMKRSQGSSPQHHSNFKRRPEMDSSGFHGDTFNSGFGDFWTMKRNALARPLAEKRRPEMDSSGFHGDTFNSGFGDFWTMKRDGYPWATKSQAGGVRENYGKRRPEMDSSGFHGDTFNGDFGGFWTMKRSDGDRARWPMGRMEAKRRPEMDSSGFHGDTFNSGFGDFWTMKRAGQGGLTHPLYFRGVKRRPEMDSSGFHGDTFNGGFGDFWTMKRSRGMTGLGQAQPDKRRPEMDSSGFHGDTFNSGFGDFWTMKRSADSGPWGRAAEEGSAEEAEGELRPHPGGSTDGTADAKAGGEEGGKSSWDKQDLGSSAGSSSTGGGKPDNPENKFGSTKE